MMLKHLRIYDPDTMDAEQGLLMLGRSLHREWGETDHGTITTIRVQPYGSSLGGVLTVLQPKDTLD